MTESMQSPCEQARAGASARACHMLRHGLRSAVLAACLGAGLAATPLAGASQAARSPAPPQAQSLAEMPQVRADLLELVGYARGSYTMPQALVMTQVLQALHSDTARRRTPLDDGRYLLSSLDETTQGRDRAALLYNAQGRLVAAGLINGQCHLGDEGLLDCHAEDEAWLSVFVPVTRAPARDGVIVSTFERWAAQPPQLADAPLPQRIAHVELVPVEAGAQTWGAAQLPAGFPLAFVALAPGHVALETAAGGGVYTFPPALEGVALVNDWDEQEGRPPRAFEIAWRSYAPYEEVRTQSMSRAGGARLQRGAHGAVLSGERDGYSYMLQLDDEGEAGVLITLALWRGTLPHP
ncbi:hypothetical protein ACILG0_19990 [Pseudomonadota bacterium AL_CKDN230030165-1A_HGKHYDSX7]